MKNRKFAEEETLQVNIKDAEGNPIENEKELTEEQINFCSKVAHAMYKKFSASKVKKFDAETEEIDVTLPEDIENVDIEEVAQEASDARDAAAEGDQVTVTVEDNPETPTDNEEINDFCDTVKQFAAKARKFARKAKKFDAEDLECVQEALEEVTDAVEDLVEDQKTDEIESIEDSKEFCKKFAATLARLRKAKKFSAKDLAEVEKLEDQLEETVEEINDTVLENDGEGEGVADVKKFTANKIAKQIGASSIDQFKADFFKK